METSQKNPPENGENSELWWARQDKRLPASVPLELLERCFRALRATGRHAGTSPAMQDLALGAGHLAGELELAAKEGFAGADVAGGAVVRVSKAGLELELETEAGRAFLLNLEPDIALTMIKGLTEALERWSVGYGNEQHVAEVR